MLWQADNELRDMGLLQLATSARYENGDTICRLHMRDRLVEGSNLVNDDFHTEASDRSLIIEA